MIRRILALTLLLGLAVAVGAAAVETNTETVVTLETTQGHIVLRFFPESAPEHVKNFLWHAEHTYRGCLFHRVVPGFMIQGGDPNSKDNDPFDDGGGGFSYHGEGVLLKAEFNNRHHGRGILSMARYRAPDSAGSQFFLMHGDAGFLDGQYTVFGEVIDGIEVVDLIANSPRRTDDSRLKERPAKDQRILDTLIEQWPTEQVEAAKRAMIESDPGVR